MKYCDIEELEKCDKLFNYIVTARSVGKTTSMKKRFVRRFLEEGVKFLYVRRREVELQQKKMKGFFDKFQSEMGYYADHQLDYENHVFYCDGEVMGYAVSLSTSHNERSVDYYGIEDIYFEEFVIHRQPNNDYLADEVGVFMELYTSVDRMRGTTKVWFLGNKINEFNPYFLYFDLIPPKEGIKTRGEHAIMYWSSEQMEEESLAGRYGNLIRNTPYSDYAVKNVAWKDNHEMISRIPKKALPIIKVWHMEKPYTVFSILGENRIWIGATNPKCDIVFTTDETKASEKLPHLKYLKTINPLHHRIWLDALRANKVYCTNTKVSEVERALNKIIYFGR